MKKHPQTIIVVLLSILLLAACMQHPSKETGVKQASDQQAEAAITGSGSGKDLQPERASEQPVETVAGRYEQLQGYRFLIPDQWQIVTPEHFKEVPDRWEAAPNVYDLYMVYGDQNHQKARFYFGTVSGGVYLENPDKQFKNDAEQLESLRKRLRVDSTKVVENKQMKVNGFDVYWAHCTYSKSLEKGDVIMKLLYRNGSVFWIIGTFSAPLYSELQEDIAAVLDSIKEE